MRVFSLSFVAVAGCQFSSQRWHRRVARSISRFDKIRAL
jgi:hypothetical protein